MSFYIVVVEVLAGLPLFLPYPLRSLSVDWTNILMAIASRDDEENRHECETYDFCPQKREQHFSLPTDSAYELGFKKGPRQLRLANNGHQGAGAKLRMLGDWHSDRRVLCSSLHYDVAASSSHL